MADFLVIFGSVVVILFLIYGISTLIADLVSSYINKRRKEKKTLEQYIGKPRIVRKPHSELTINAFVGTDTNEYLKKNYSENLNISLRNIRAEIVRTTETDFKILGDKIYTKTENGLLSKYGKKFSPEEAIEDFLKNYEKVTVCFEIEKTEK